MVCKQFWASDQLAQPPLLWCPHSWYAQLRQVPWARRDRNRISERQVKDYKKTAEAVVQKPWCLLRAGAYLDKWVADNQAGTYGGPSDHPIAYGHGLLRTYVGGGHGCRVAGLRAGSPSAH